MLNRGEIAPDFALAGSGGKQLALSGFNGRYVVLYFYPKDDTPACTKEAIDFSGLKPEFKALGAEVIGVSPDTAQSHGKFRQKHALEITLLADGEKAAIHAYGVWAEKKMYGKTYMGVERTTFLIGPDGKILEIWRGVKVPGHAAAVLEALKRHQPNQAAVL
jgi:thioredoxin-dependent peroxiredoxin